MAELKARLSELGYEHAHGRPCSAKALNLAADALERIAELESELQERDRRIAELEARNEHLARDLVHTIEARDKLETERDKAMRELCLADCALEWGCQRDEVNAEMLRDNASAEYGPDVAKRLFPEQPVARQAASRRGDRGQDP